MARRPKWAVVLTFLASLLFPLFGVVYGALETCKGEKADRRRGKICMALGIAGITLVCAGAAVWLALGLKAGVGFLVAE
ncbi:MAG: hypothetical protein GTN49_11735 [candidate division Zixibacteria bacterium]|nr:hypothetical protein [candidate division Zixibacteria bacterium]